MVLSKRLSRIAECIGYADCVADIGTDHAYLPIALIKQRRAEHVIGLDIREKPLMRAKANIREAGLEDRITLRLSDGAEKLLPGEADLICISGMGGALMGRILADRPEVFQTAKRLYFSPQSELCAFRSLLMKLGYRITDEWMVCDEGKFYFIIQAEAGETQKEYAPYELHFGRHLLMKRDRELYGFLQRERRIQSQILARLLGLHTEHAAVRIKEIKSYLNIIEEACSYYSESPAAGRIRVYNEL